MKVIVLAAVLALNSLPTATQAPPFVATVFVFTDVKAPGNPTPEEAERLAIVERVQRGIPDTKRVAFQTALAPDLATATIGLEIVSAANTTRATPLGNQVMVMPSYLISAKLTFGTYSTDLAARESEQSYRRSAKPSTADQQLDAATENFVRIKASGAMNVRIKEWIAANEGDIQRR